MRFKILKQGGYGSGGISETGGNMSGPLVLAADPTHPLQAASKGYVDTALGALNAASLVTGIVPIERLPAFTGDITNVAGNNVFSLSDSGITPGTYPKVTVNAKGRVTNGYLLSESDLPAVDWSKVTTGKPNTMAGYGITDAISPSGGTMTDNLVLNNQPTTALHAANKAYIDGIVASNASGSFKTGDIVRKVTATTPPGFLRANGGEVSQTTYSALFAVLSALYIKSTTLDYTPHTAIGAGQPWRQQYNFRSTSQTDITGWTAGPALPENINWSQAIVTKNRVYLIGGQIAGSATNKVYTAAIDDSGALGAWSAATNFPITVYGHSAFVTKNKVFVVAGYNGSTYNSLTYSADINADGTLGTWTNTANSIPNITQMAAVVVTKNRVYLIGGQNNTSGYINTIQYALINSDGTLGAWTNYTSALLPAGLAGAGVAVTKNFVYLITGYTNGTTYTAAVYVAAINSDGTLGAWSTATALPYAGVGTQAVVLKNRLFVYGQFLNGSWAPYSYSAVINADGTLGSWVQGTSTNENYATSQAIVTKSRIYLIGKVSGNVVGYATITGDVAIHDYTALYNGTINKFDGSDLSGDIVVQNDYPASYPQQPGAGRPWHQHFMINNAAQNADLSSWGSNGSLPTAVSDAGVFVTKNRVYLIGGQPANGTTPLATVHYAVINANGSLGSWTAAGTLPGAISNISNSIAVTKNRVYIVGGSNAAGNPMSTMYTAPINADGSLGAWTTDTGLPWSGYTNGVFVTKNRIHVAGGVFSTGHTYNAPINTDGTIGTWVQGPTLPQAMIRAATVVTKNRVYVIGGWRSGSNNNSSVYTAVINTDGTIGNWSTAASMPGVASSLQAYATANRIWVFAFSDGTSTFNKVYTAPINSEGVIGTWTTSTNTGPGVAQSTMAAVNGRLYTFGGANGTSSTTTVGTVYYTTIAGGLADYSAYYDGTITFTESGNFRLPDYSAKEMPGSYTYIKA